MTKEQWQERSWLTLENLADWRAALVRMIKLLLGLPSDADVDLNIPGMNPGAGEFEGDDSLDPNARLRELMKQFSAAAGISEGKKLIYWIDEVILLLKKYDALFDKFPDDEQKALEAEANIEQVEAIYQKYYHGPVT